MPTHTTTAPNPITTRLSEGAAAFAAFWRTWRNQWSQPQLLKLADQYLGQRLFHSSQMGGFAKQILRDPAPKVFLAVGFLNVAHARSIHVDEALIQPTPDIGLPQKLPDTLRALWEGRQPLCDGDGVVLGPTGLFEAFTGLRALPYDSSRIIFSEHEEKVSEALGRWLRLRLATQGIDWLSELPMLRSQCDILEPLLVGRTVGGDALVFRLPQLAAIAGTTVDDLWGVIEGATVAPS